MFSNAKCNYVSKYFPHYQNGRHLYIFVFVNSHCNIFLCVAVEAFMYVTGRPCAIIGGFSQLSEMFQRRQS